MTPLETAIAALRQYADPDNWQGAFPGGRLDQWMDPTDGPALAQRALDVSNFANDSPPAGTPTIIEPRSTVVTTEAPRIENHASQE